MADVLAYKLMPQRPSYLAGIQALRLRNHVDDSDVVLQDRSVSHRRRHSLLEAWVAEQGGQGSGLGSLEAEVMSVLWRAEGPLTVRDVAAALNADRSSPLAYTTVMTVMSRLARKEILSRSLAGRRFVYTPAAADTAEIAVRGVLAEFGDAALARFVDRVEVDPQLRARLRRLMEEQQ